jgi:aryl-alcohol dehydrogenase-like predicted oxidoreductase
MEVKKMKYKLLGKSGLRVSELCLGTMTTSISNPWGWGQDREQSLSILKTYSEAGGNFIDTACNYQNGESEQLIGEFLEGDRDRYVIATKFTLREGDVKGDPNYGGNARKNLIRSVEQSLDRLKTDYLDVLYLHVWDETVDIEHVMKFLNDLVTSSKVNYIAISDTPAWIVSRMQTIAEQRGWYQFQAFQFPYSLGSRDPEREVMPMCRELDMAMTPWAVLGAGLFTGKYTRGEGSDGRLTEGKWGAPSEKGINMARTVDEVADEIGVSSATVALRWAMDQPGVVLPIVGATRPEQLTENIGATEVVLSDDQMNRLNDLAKFDRGFAYDFVHAPNVKNLIHGDTYELLQNHKIK